jgi:hypothetical protein
VLTAQQQLVVTAVQVMVHSHHGHQLLQQVLVDLMQAVAAEVLTQQATAQAQVQQAAVMVEQAQSVLRPVQQTQVLVVAVEVVLSTQAVAEQAESLL